MDTEYFKVYNTGQAVWAQIAFIFNLEMCAINARRTKRIEISRWRSQHVLADQGFPGEWLAEMPIA